MCPFHRGEPDPSDITYILMLGKLDSQESSLPPPWTQVQRAGLLVAILRHHSSPLQETCPWLANSHSLLLRLNWPRVTLSTPGRLYPLCSREN